MCACVIVIMIAIEQASERAGERIDATFTSERLMANGNEKKEREAERFICYISLQKTWGTLTHKNVPHLVWAPPPQNKKQDRLYKHFIPGTM